MKWERQGEEVLWVLGVAYCWDTRGIVLGLWRAKGGELEMEGGEGG